MIDWYAFVEALQDINYQGPFNYECLPPGDNLEEKITALENNFEWMNDGLVSR